MSARDCNACGPDGHTLACAAKRVPPAPSDAELARIRAEANKLHHRILVWAADNRTPWAPQLVADMSRVVGTVKWIEGDIERRRVDAEKQERGE